MDSQIIINQVNSLLRNRRTNDALALLEQAVNEAPSDASLISALGRMYRKINKPELAIQYLRRALELQQLEKLHSNYDVITSADLAYHAEVEDSYTEEAFEYPELAPEPAAEPEPVPRTLPLAPLPRDRRGLPGRALAIGRRNGERKVPGRRSRVGLPRRAQRRQRAL